MEVQGVPQYVAFAGDTVVKFPKYVVFKGDNDNYLAAFWTESHEYLQFNTTDIGSGRVSHEVVEVGEGTGIVMLKCLHWNKFWRRSPNWIWADTANANTSNKDMLFHPIKVDDERVALCSLVTTILRVQEPILSRRVHSIEYDMDTARIYDSQPGTLFKATVTNPSDQPAVLQVAYAYMQKKSTSWKRGVSFKTGVKTTFQAGIPFVVGGNVEVSAEFTVSGEWGGTEESQTTVTGTYNAPVKAGETVEVPVRGVHAKCDVQFSYTQVDLITTGETVKTLKKDGVFSGVNTTDIKFEVRSL
ncbi:hypothetical protein SUGI_0482380 [Cryptomeria japonica]|nr:hypothetical protein SUGI_0482380 [Cryptomeria japonica]